MIMKFFFSFFPPPFFFTSIHFLEPFLKVGRVLATGDCEHVLG